MENDDGNTLINEYRTMDFGIAAALITLKHSMLGMDRTNPKRIKFIFAMTDEIQNVEDLYWRNALEVDARAMHENIKMLKGRVYSTAE